MEVLKRLGVDWESTVRLARKAAEAKQAIGIHGVSATAAELRRPASHCDRGRVEAEFRVHDTPTRSDPLHRTIELPEPVTDESAAIFNRLFGRVEE